MSECECGLWIEEMKILRSYPVRHAFPDRRPHPHMRHRHHQLSRHRHRHMALVSEPLVRHDASRLATAPAQRDAVRTNADDDPSPVADGLPDFRPQLVVAEAKARTMIELEGRPIVG